jgi:hypothetical protein
MCCLIRAVEHLKGEVVVENQAMVEMRTENWRSVTSTTTNEAEK